MQDKTTRTICCVAVAAMSLGAGVVRGETRTWVGPGSDWFEAGHWLDAAGQPGAPAAGDTVIVGAGASILLTNETPALAAFTMSGGTLTVSGWTSAIVAREMAITGTVTHAANTVASTNSLGEWVPQHRVLIQGSNLTLAAAGRINTDTLGYRGGGAGPGCGPGGGAYNPSSHKYGGGASHGGLGGHGHGGALCGLPYGLPDWPWQPGSGGANNGGPGGGAVWIELDGRLQVDGEIRANGGTGVSGNYGGGSGGAITIACRTFAGSGWLRANGASGNSNGGGGGGGRIALHFDGPLQAQSVVSVPRFQATGSTVAKWFHSESVKDYAHGSVYLSDLGFFAEGWPAWEGWLHAPTNRLDVAGDLTLAACHAAFATVRTLTVDGNLTLGNAGKLFLAADATAAPALPGAQLDVDGSILIQSGGALYPWSHPTNGASVRIRAANLTVESGGAINASGRGFRGGSSRLADDPDGPIADGYGPGGGKKGTSGSASYGGGGSYGGWGGDGYAGYRGGRYGVADQVCQPGSGGAAGGIAGYGGGLVWVECDGHVRIDGNLLADGDPYADGYAGGGSGGGVSIRCRTLDGGGRIQASGGSGSGNGGTGGGGRIALHFDPVAQRAIDPPALFCELKPGASGVIKRSSPIDWRMGTLYLADPVLLGGDWSNWAGWLHVPTNHLHHGGDLAVSAGWAAVASPHRLTIAGDFQINGPGTFLLAPEPTAANYIPGAELVVGGALEVGDGATLLVHSHATNGAPLKITAARVTVAEGGVICGDERGYYGREEPWPAYGPGAGIQGTSTTHGSGAGYGGAGGYGYNGKPGGPPYGLPLAPLEPGSGGGGYYYGGHGGATVWIVTPGVLRIDGEIRSNGGALRGSYNGSGSGGGILLAARRIVGGTNGVIRADGADGNVYGGAGAGGRIACWQGIPEAFGGQLIRGEVTAQAVAPKPAAFEGATSVLGGTGYTFYTGPNEYYNKAGDGSVVWLSEQGTVLMVR